MKRYTTVNNVLNCKDGNYRSSMIYEIQKLLVSAKSASVTKARMNDQLLEFYTNYDKYIHQNVLRYKNKLHEIKAEYTNLLSDFKILRSLFIMNTNGLDPSLGVNDKNGMLKISDCSK